MNESKKILFLLITLTLVTSCGSGGNDENGGSDAPGSCTPNPNSRYLSVTLRPQADDYWCWAASGEMVMEKLGATITQCDEANKQFGREDCCPASRPAACDKGGWPEFDKYGFTADQTDEQALTWTNVKRQIDCQNTPFCATWKGSGGGGHMVVISGYKIQDGVKKVKVLDPLPVNHGATRWVTYSYYVSHPGYSHWNDYYNIKKETDSQNSN